MNQTIAFCLFFCLTASASAQLDTINSRIAPGADIPSKPLTLEQRLEIQQQRQRARQTIPHPVPTRDFACLKTKQIGQMTREELELLPLVDPDRFNQEIDQHKTPGLSPLAKSGCHFSPFILFAQTLRRANNPA
jgi:hypothetical protein